MPKQEVPGAVQRAIERVGLAERAEDKMKTLSGGMIRRVGIAQAIVNDPVLLLLDEPTAGLDPAQRLRFRELLQEIGRDACVVVSTHLVEDVAAACSDVVLFAAGKLVFQGTPADLAEAGSEADVGDSPIERGYSALLGHAHGKGPGDARVPDRAPAHHRRLGAGRDAGGESRAAAVLARAVDLRLRGLERDVADRGAVAALPAGADVADHRRVAAIQGMRDARAGVGELFGSTPRPAGQRAATLGLALGLAAVVGYLVLVAAGAGQVVAKGGLFTTAWVMQLVLGVLSVLAGVALGLGVGRLLPYPITAPALAVLVLAGGLYAQVSGVTGAAPNAVALLGIGQVQPHGPFDLPRPAVEIGQLSWLLGLTAAGIVLLLANSARTRLLALLPVAAGLAAALPIFPASSQDNYVPDKTAAALVCDGPVCVTRLHEGWLSTVAGPGKEALQQLEKLPQHPARVEESTESFHNTKVGPRDPARILIQQDAYELHNKSGSSLTMALLGGAGTRPCHASSYGGERNDREDAARWAMAQWLAALTRRLHTLSCRPGPTRHGQPSRQCRRRSRPPAWLRRGNWN